MNNLPTLEEQVAEFRVLLGHTSIYKLENYATVWEDDLEAFLKQALIIAEQRGYQRGLDDAASFVVSAHNKPSDV